MSQLAGCMFQVLDHVQSQQKSDVFVGCCSPYLISSGALHENNRIMAHFALEHGLPAVILFYRTCLPPALHSAAIARDTSASR